MKTIPLMVSLANVVLFFGGVVSALIVHPARADIDIEFVTVGDAGNFSDPTTGYGAVDYEFAIGKYEVTNAQYAEFLNVKAKSDPLGLYNNEMATDPNSGILRAGLNGSFSYPVKPGFGNKPVVFVSFLHAMRFANWLNNGKGTGDTETGAYTLSLGGLAPRNAGARVWVPSEDEWYKAAYYQTALQGGDLDYYWYFATRSNTGPTLGGPNDSDANSANWNGGYGALTDVGAYSLARSFYGTFDQVGNVSELNDTIIGSARGRRGGSFSDHRASSLSRETFSPLAYTYGVGFRVARGADPDTDGDGIPDRFETATGVYVSPMNTGTSPTNPDTDADGLNDGEEVNTYHTNPNLPDTDGDGFDDGFEVATGFSPTSPTSTPDALSSIRTAAEYRFNAANGVSYRIEASTDLATWTTIETPIVGTGGVITRFYSIEGQTRRYFRSRRN